MYERAVEADPDHANSLGDYALFLHYARRDYDRAEEMYERAIAADPNHAYSLGNYALFLETVRHDHDRAEEMQGLGKVGGGWSDVRGCRRVGAGAARPGR